MRLVAVTMVDAPQFIARARLAASILDQEGIAQAADQPELQRLRMAASDFESAQAAAAFGGGFRTPGLMGPRYMQEDTTTTTAKTAAATGRTTVTGYDDENAQGNEDATTIAPAAEPSGGDGGRVGTVRPVTLEILIISSKSSN